MHPVFKVNGDKTTGFKDSVKMFPSNCENSVKQCKGQENIDALEGRLVEPVVSVTEAPCHEENV